MDLKKLQEPLPIESIDFRVQSINNGAFATILPYKDARVDINRLNEVCGVLGWKREHTRDNKNCVVSIWDADNKHWVSKEDTGVESNAEKEKGLASDSFKRACFNWGIGIELYDYPIIQIKLLPHEFKDENGKKKPTWQFKLKEWVWISEFRDGKLNYLSATDDNGKLRYEYKKGIKNTPIKKTTETKVDKWLSDDEFKQAKTLKNGQLQELLHKYSGKPYKDGKVYNMKKEYKTELLKIISNG